MNDPATYDAWYLTPRGRWIGQAEWRLLRGMLELRTDESVLDAGCGTGYFTRHLAGTGGFVVGLDVDIGAATFARRSAVPPLKCIVGDMAALPFADRSFDCVVAVTSLCFVAEEQRAVAELLRVTRRRLVLGLLNRRSLLWRQKGRGAGSKGYAGARWHTANEAERLFAGLPATQVRVGSAVMLPSGGPLARFIERLWPRQLPYGGFLAVSVSPAAACRRKRH